MASDPVLRRTNSKNGAAKRHSGSAQEEEEKDAAEARLPRAQNFEAIRVGICARRLKRLKKIKLRKIRKKKRRPKSKG